MLPQVLLTPMWLLVAVLFPALQSLHALREKSADTKVWLFYWLCYVAAVRLHFLYGWFVRIPFHVLSYLFVDIYYEVQLVLVGYLVVPRFMGIRRLSALLASKSGEAASRLAMSVISRTGQLSLATLSKHVDGAARSAQTPKDAGDVDVPGKYTIIKQAGVTTRMETVKAHVVGQLNVGDVVDVLEVVHNTEERRVRARIEDPPGWISLLNAETGTRWAVRAGQGDALRGVLAPQAGEVFAHAEAAGCNPTALFQGGAAIPAAEATAGDAWEAMALLESQLSRADDFSEDAMSRQAAGMLRQMLTSLVQTGNPAMLTMAQAMMPDLGKIWANESTREYLQALLANSPNGLGGITDNAGSVGASAGSASGSA
mmetsp:Transcript_55370/g.154231  ORF Transcript_55370/g.154231 Transcript_55370/m.154231 type:complete len:371 (+) Transcript_55370:41-1153(+)|eukprot:CAMPEP_0117490166 /NCGR_PEP_ID=MMETSP0784-20121206/17411_1 /TAXON_ID=39447 /ORGANISM="" /LENGTH=370 /DNA_ID=CAMNT_0005284917 /DNA_START=40 /DNA_END=1152 /DNA_ORIENTATION=+